MCVAVLADDRRRAHPRQAISGLGTLTLSHLGDELGGRPEPGAVNQLGEEELLQAHAGRGRARLVRPVHSVWNISYLDRRHSAILALRALVGGPVRPSSVAIWSSLAGRVAPGGQVQAEW